MKENNIIYVIIIAGLLLLGCQNDDVNKIDNNYHTDNAQEQYNKCVNEIKDMCESNYDGGAPPDFYILTNSEKCHLCTRKCNAQDYQQNGKYSGFDTPPTPSLEKCSMDCYKKIECKWINPYDNVYACLEKEVYQWCRKQVKSLK